jgi:hypothetical protein
LEVIMSPMSSAPPKPGLTLRAAFATAALWSAVVALWPWEVKVADRQENERGRYLVTLGGCLDCRNEVPGPLAEARTPTAFVMTSGAPQKP